MAFFRRRRSAAPPSAHEPLDAFLGAWFHQDCCMNGETLEDIVAEYRAAAWRDERLALEADIERFLRESPSDVDARLEATFRLDIVPSAFAQDGETFLPKVLRLLRGIEREGSGSSGRSPTTDLLDGQSGR